MDRPTPDPDRQKRVKPASASEELSKEAWENVVFRSVQEMHDGTVKIYVHDSRVVQVEAIERIRLQPLPPKGKKPPRD